MDERLFFFCIPIHECVEKYYEDENYDPYFEKQSKNPFKTKKYPFGHFPVSIELKGDNEDDIGGREYYRIRGDYIGFTFYIYLPCHSYDMRVNGKELHQIIYDYLKPYLNNNFKSSKDSKLPYRLFLPLALKLQHNCVLVNHTNDPLPGRANCVIVFINNREDTMMNRYEHMFKVKVKEIKN